MADGNHHRTARFTLDDGRFGFAMGHNQTRRVSFTLNGNATVSTSFSAAEARTVARALIDAADFTDGMVPSREA